MSFFCKICVWENVNKQKEAQCRPIFKCSLVQILGTCVLQYQLLVENVFWERLKAKIGNKPNYWWLSCSTNEKKQFHWTKTYSDKLLSPSLVYLMNLLLDDNDENVRKTLFFVDKNRQIPASFCLFSSFSHHNSNINWKSVDFMLGDRTRGRRMVGCTVLWWLAM